VTPVPLNGWFLRDSHFRGPRKGPIKGRGFKLPANAVIPAGGSIQVHVGRGPNTPTDLFWGLDESVFGNATDDKTQIGDGAYLLDPKGNVRAYTMYPCRAGNCTDPLAGKVKVISRYQGGKQPATGQINEWMTIKNVSVAPISLNEYELESSPWFYEFDQRDVIAPGKAIVVFVDKPYARVPAAPGAGNVTVPALPGRAPFQDVQLGGFRAWNFDLPLLADGGDVVTLRNPGGAPVVCDSWGGDRCPNV
jgi:hypothetical protein